MSEDIGLQINVPRHPDGGRNTIAFATHFTPGGLSIRKLLPKYTLWLAVHWLGTHCSNNNTCQPTIFTCFIPTSALHYQNSDLRHNIYAAAWRWWNMIFKKIQMRHNVETPCEEAPEATWLPRVFFWPSRQCVSRNHEYGGHVLDYREWGKQFYFAGPDYCKDVWHMTIKIKCLSTSIRGGILIIFP